MKRPLFITSQSVLEYAVVIVCIVAGLVGMQVYITRSMQGRMKESSENIGNLYAPDKTISLMNSAYRVYTGSTTHTREIVGTSNTTSSAVSSENYSTNVWEQVLP
jgi:hypothetical protein